jgi:hypothetical protein
MFFKFRCIEDIKHNKNVCVVWQAEEIQSHTAEYHVFNVWEKQGGLRMLTVQ